MSSKELCILEYTFANDRAYYTTGDLSDYKVHILPPRVMIAIHRETGEVSLPIPYFSRNIWTLLKNEKTRRMYCHITGIQYKDLAASYRRVQRQAEKKRRADEIDSLKEAAERLGYEVRVKKTTKTK